MEISPPLRASPPFTPFHPFVNRVGVKVCACIKSSMLGNEWYGGYWLNGSGAWTYQPKGSWHQDSTGWWFGDTSGWYAKNTTVKIDGVSYTFNAAGYWVK